MPLAIDLFCGLFGWAEGLIAEGFDVIGFDLEDMCGQFNVARPPQAQLVIQDVLTLHGAQFKNADLIVASPPCQEYSYMAMPWKIAKAKATAIRADTTGESINRLNRLFDACFRIQREACEAAGRHSPTVIENVRGAQPWVGRARWNFGSYYLWGDVPALMPIIKSSAKMPGCSYDVNRSKEKTWGPHHAGACAAAGIKNSGFRFDGSGRSFQTESVNRHVPDEGYKSSGMNCSDQSRRGQDFTRIAGQQSGLKVPTEGTGRRTDVGKGARFTSRDCGLEDAGRKIGGDWFNDSNSTCRMHSSKSKARKMASAMIAKIPYHLSRHIAATYKPREPKQ